VKFTTLYIWEDQIAVTHLADSHGVGLRHAAVNAHRDKLKKKKAAVGQNSKSGDLSDSVSDPNSSMIAKELDTCMAFGKPSFPDWLEKLPPEWTVIQITVNIFLLLDTFFHEYLFLNS